jgi:hypothetical protein
MSRFDYGAFDFFALFVGVKGPAVIRIIGAFSGK